MNKQEIRSRAKLEDALHFAKKHEQRVWGGGSDHKKAHEEVQRLETLLAQWTWCGNMGVAKASATGIDPGK